MSLFSLWVDVGCVHVFVELFSLEECRSYDHQTWWRCSEFLVRPYTLQTKFVFLVNPKGVISNIIRQYTRTLYGYGHEQTSKDVRSIHVFLGHSITAVCSKWSKIARLKGHVNVIGIMLQYHTYNIFKCELFLCLDDVSDYAVQVQSSRAGMIDNLMIGRQFNFVWVIW